MKTGSILKQTANCPFIPPDPGASLTARRLYCAFHKQANSKVQTPPSQLSLSLPSIIITITSNQPWNRETHKTDWNPQITNHDLLNPWSKVLFPKRSVKMIDSSKKRNRRLASELQNSHVWEKCDLIYGPQSTWKRPIFSTRWKMFSFKVFLMVFFSKLRNKILCILRPKKV